MGSPFVLIVFVVSLTTKKMCISCLNKMHVILSARNNCSSYGFITKPQLGCQESLQSSREKRGIYIGQVELEYIGRTGWTGSL